ncbi:MAG: efflux RND transporter periplasmic adaptor subunit [Oscillospiraceae bacterium]|nr:efflux RND transporter periplasmic adaptor subunit [Oscillospiraceae bacterium]
MKKYIKWAFLGIFITAGAWAAIIAPQATLNMLPEAETVHPRSISHREVVRGAGVIFSRGDTFFLSAAVREGDINAVRVGQPAELYGAAIGDGIYTAVVREIADFARQQEFGGLTETVVDVILELYNKDETDVNPYEFIRVGYTAEARINIGEPRELVLVPYAAIDQDDRGEYVFVLAGNTALRRDIVTGIELAEGAELLAGIREDDELIVRPERFAENSLVKAMES